MPARRLPSLAAGAAALVLLLTGCGDDGGRPTVDEVAAALPDEGLDEGALECLATAFVDSEISDSGLRTIVDAGGLSGTSGLSTEDVTAAQQAAADGLGCAGTSAAADLSSSTTTAPESTEPSTTAGG